MATSRRIRFGVFEANTATRELHRSGLKVRIQSQPFRVLMMLLERPGEVVSREEIQRRIWGEGTTVDFDHGLGTAINKLREALGDTADNPRFVETLSKRGYRFIAPVEIERSEPEVIDEAGAASRLKESALEFPKPEVAKTNVVVAPRLSAEIQSRTRSAIVLRLVSGVCVFLAIVVCVWAWGRASELQRPLEVQQITFTGRVSPGEPLQEDFGGAATDGSRVFFTQIEGGSAMLAQSLIADGETSLFSVPPEIGAPSISDISPDGSELLIRNHLAPLAEQALWIMPTLGDAARNLGNLLGHDATWMPDGHRVLYASGFDLFLINEDGTNPIKFVDLPGRAFWLRWSPNGSVLRFTLLDPLNHTTSLWSIGADGKNLHPLLPGWSMPASECCGNWTPDGKYYLFQSSHSGLSNIWALERVERLPWMGHATPLQITNGPLSYRAPVTARAGHRVLFTGLDTRTVLLQFSDETKQFVRYAKGLTSAQLVEFSRDGKWVAWIRPGDSTLWRSRPDGTQKLQLTSKPMAIFMMHWSPDGSQLVFMGHEPGSLWKAYVVSAMGGEAVPVLKEERNQADPDWSADGNSILFGRVPDLMAERSRPKAIYIFDLKTKEMAKVPGSDGLFSPRWSPDGRYIAALPLDQQRLMLYDTKSAVWKTIIDSPSHDPVWSSDGKWIYVHDFMADSQPLYRVSVPDGRVERVAGLNSLRPLDVVDFRFSGLAPGNVPLVSARLSTANIYSIDLDQRY